MRIVVFSDFVLYIIYTQQQLVFFPFQALLLLFF